MVRRLLIAFATTLAMLSLSCAPANPSKVSHGQRYVSGDRRYDAYFEEVHRKQEEAARWDGRVVSARRPLVRSVGVKKDASNSALVAAVRAHAKATGFEGRLDLKGGRVTSVHAKPSHASFRGAIEQTAHAELDLVSDLRGSARRFDDLAKRGEKLRRESAHASTSHGHGHEAERHARKRREVARELDASVSALRSLADDARSRSETTEAFLEDLAVAIGGVAREHHHTPSPSRPAPTEPSPRPAQAPQPSQPAEVFNP